jgi:hypothetical protein
LLGKDGAIIEEIPLPRLLATGRPSCIVISKVA